MVDPDILSYAKCTILISRLTAWPYSLPWGSSVYAKVVAHTGNGDSLESVEGNGAVIYTYPDSPSGLTENITLRTATTITFYWTAPTFVGGTPVVDYSVFYDNALLTYSPLESGIETTTYTAEGLQAGLTYRFKVQARNIYGFSYDSEEVAILCARRPSKPVPPTSTN